MVKRLFMVILVVSVVNVAALVGLGVYAWSRGWLTRERILAAIGALRGEEGEPKDAAVVATGEAETPSPARERIQHNVEQEGEIRLQFDRREREIRDSLRMLEARGLALLREKEAFEERKRRLADAEEKRAEEAGNSGLQKELEILSGAKAKEAKELLRQKDDAEVVWMLRSMESRKVNKIVSACKTEEERLWIGRILGKLSEHSATQAEALEAGS
ncbi:MAG: hypothetical protein JXQ75_21565 [Phycisphaerae bacterium]|nr:hypothetical protein [Phycisphaerae bacterium]